MKNKYEIRGDVTVIHIERKDGKKLEALIDTSDLEKVNNLNANLCAVYSKDNDSFYVSMFVRDGFKKHKNVALHRYIIDCPNNMVVDHINHVTLDNRKINLRIVTSEENKQNLKGARSDNKKSNVIGVGWHKASGKWQVRSLINKKRTVIGYYEDFEEAKKISIEARSKNYPFSKEAANNSYDDKENVKSTTTKARPNNKSGIRNVAWHKYSKKWTVEFLRKGKLFHYGYYTDLEEAAKVAEKARKSLKTN